MPKKTDPTTASEALEAAAKQVERATESLDRARTQLNQVIREARATGLTLEQIGKTVGLTRMRISQIVNGK